MGGGAVKAKTTHSTHVVPAAMPKVYTIRRCRADDTLYGPVHWSADAKTTFCGLDLSNNLWWVLSNDFGGEATCKKCIKAAL